MNSWSAKYARVGAAALCVGIVAYAMSTAAARERSRVQKRDRGQTEVTQVGQKAAVKVDEQQRATDAKLALIQRDAAPLQEVQKETRLFIDMISEKAGLDETSRKLQDGALHELTRMAEHGELAGFDLESLYFDKAEGDLDLLVDILLQETQPQDQNFSANDRLAFGIPGNDTCAAATVIGAVPFTELALDLPGATDDADANPSCDSSGNSAGANNGVWYQYTPAVTCGARVTLSDTPDTVATIWTGGCGTLTQSGCDDEPEAGLFVDTPVTLTGGNTYWILVSAWSSTNPTLPTDFTFNCIVPACGNGTIEAGEQCDDGNTASGDGCSATCQNEPEPCDTCADAALCTVTDGAPAFTGATTNNTASGLGAGCGSGGDLDEWLQYTATCTGTLVMDTDGTTGDGGDTLLSLYQTDCATLIECDDDDGAGLQSRIERIVTAGNVFNVRVSGWGTPNVLSSYVLNIACNPGFCGDGSVAGAEQCDDGNTASGDGCSSTCITEFCGDGITNNNGEECDDGNTAAGDGCGATCLLECGNGVVDPGETCDDSNTASNDGCSSTCQTEGCGDGIVQAGEECDDGNTSLADCCDNTCMINHGPAPDACTDRIAIGLGNTATNTTGACTDGLQHAVCQFTGVNEQINDDHWYNHTAADTGTLIVSFCNQEGGDADYDTDLAVYNGCGTCPPGDADLLACCDDATTCGGQGGGACTASGTTFASRVAVPVVGGNCYKIRVGGFGPGDTGTGDMSLTFVPRVCGNGFLETGEECDDGNTANGDGCTAQCDLEQCGNGTIEGGELCDDSNTVDGDGCDSNCTPTGCGNGVVTGVEECDDGNTASGDGCNSVCVAEICGNGTLDAGEDCDDGNTADGDGCDSNCTPTGCGNGIVTAPETCDDGNTANGDCCSSTCIITLPANDVCASASAVGDGSTPFNTTCATASGAQPNCGGTTTPPVDLWYSYTATCSGELTIDTEGSGYDTRLTVWSACGGTIIDCDDDGGTGLLSLIELIVNTNDVVLIQVGGFNAAIGTGSLNISCSSGFCGDGTVDAGEECDDGNTADSDGCTNCVSDVCGDGIVNNGGVEECDDGNTNDADCCSNSCIVSSGPAPDACVDRVVINDGVTAFDTTLACTDGLAHGALCEFTGSPNNTHNDIWFNYTATCSGLLTLSTCNEEGGDAAYDTDLNIYDAGGADCSALACPPTNADLLGCNDDADTTCTASGTSFASRIPGVLVVAGNCYKIRVGGFDDGDVGTGNLSIACDPQTLGACCTQGSGVCNCATTLQADCTGTWTEGGDCAATGTDNPCDCNGNGVCDADDLTGGVTKLESATCGALAIPRNEPCPLGTECDAGFVCADNDGDTIMECADCATAADCMAGEACVDTNGDGSTECAASCEIVAAFGDAGLVADLDVHLNITHTWQGDLTVAVENVTGAVGPVNMINRAGKNDLHPTGSGIFGYSADNFGNAATPAPLVLDDEAGVAINVYAGIAAGTLNYVGPAQPGGGADAAATLTTFDGLPKDGTWRIYVTDWAGGDNGTLDSWALSFTNAGTPFSMDTNSNGIPDECEGGTSCTTAADCVDLDSNVVIDDVCTWGECLPDMTCNVVARVVPADVGGSFGQCPLDTFCNIHDRNHALTCFSGTNGCASINIDAGGSFGNCLQDGFCNIHDANHALTCFAGTNTCTCGPMPEGPAGSTVGGADVELVGPRTAKAGDLVSIQVLVQGDLPSFQSYQLHLAVTGGTAGSMELENIAVEPRKDFVFGQQATFDAVNLEKGQMLLGLDTPGVATEGGYLATFTYRVSADAAGQFVVDLRHNEAQQDQTFLISGYTDRIAVNKANPAVISVSRVTRNR